MKTHHELEKEYHLCATNYGDRIFMATQLQEEIKVLYKKLQDTYAELKAAQAAEKCSTPVKK